MLLNTLCESHAVHAGEAVGLSFCALCVLFVSDDGSRTAGSSGTPSSLTCDSPDGAVANAAMRDPARTRCTCSGSRRRYAGTALCANMVFAQHLRQWAEHDRTIIRWSAGERQCHWCQQWDEEHGPGALLPGYVT